MRSAARVSTARRALTRVAVACAAVGYLLALGSTSAGQGWQLAPHLALGHTGAGPPQLVEAAPAHVVLPTLRLEQGEHVHGGGHAGHHHEHAGGHVHPPEAPEHSETEAQGVRQSGRHRHGDRVHDHQPPPERPAAPVVALDKHHPPAAQAVPAPLAASVTAATGDDAGASRSLTVETPPPVGRG